MLQKKWRKLASAVLIATMGMSLVGCSGGGSNSINTSTDTNTPAQESNTASDGTEEVASEGELPAMTTENITLTYASWDNMQLQEYLVEKFMEKYPNITVELINMDLGTWNEGLFNLASAGSLPDAFWYLGDCTAPLDNGWFYDMTELYNADPENEKVVDSLKPAGIFNGKRLSAACKNLPFAVFLDRAVFEKLNVPMPSSDWTYSEMIELAKKMTVPEQNIYGMNMYTQLLTIAPIVNQDAWGEFGWDGTTFDLTGDYADAYEQQREFFRTKVFPPAFGSEEAAQAFGDPNVWSASTGKLAMQVDAVWTANLFETPEFKDKGIDFVIYPVPKGDNASTLHKPSFVDFGGLGATTEHPREAYELLKWMGWGEEGWTYKLEGYANLTNEDGSKVFDYPDGYPITTTEELWDGLKGILPDTEYWSAYVDNVREPIALGGAYMPGFSQFLIWMGEQDINGKIDRDEVKVHDLAQELTDQLNQFYQDATSRLQ